MTGPALTHLFSPLRIGPVTIPNRIVSSGHDTMMAVDGKVGDRLIAYQQARAAGGVGLIVLQVAGVHHTAHYTSQVLMADSDECIEGLARIAERLHACGTVVFQQLFHDGREMMAAPDGALAVAVAPSAVPNERFGVMPRALTTSEVREIIGCYGAAADRVRRAGLDGVEVVASHGYLPSQFLNPRINHRTDDYGGSEQARLRFVREVVEAVRSAVGSEMAVGLRISVGEHGDEGLRSDEALDAVAALEPLLDYVSVTTGTSATHAGSGHIAASMAITSGYTLPLATRTKARVRIPVLVAGRINQPQDADRFIAAGDADAVIMTRALICDPDMPAKARAGDLDRIRACIGCNQACIGHFALGAAVSCIQHPETGREVVYGLRVRARASRRIVVVGGGPAGMKAAAVAAERGHRVTLLEASARLGGQIHLAAALPGRAEFAGAADNLAREMELAGVEVRLRTRAGVDSLMSMAPDAVVLATGAQPRRPALEVMGSLPVVDAWQVLCGHELPPGPVVVADWRSDWIGMGVATALAQRGHPTTHAVVGYHPGQRIQQYVRDSMLAAAIRAGVTVLPLVRPMGVDDDTVWLQHVLTDEAIALAASSLVLAMGHLSVDELSEDLLRMGVETHRVGDCLSPRTVEEAVLEGLEVGSLL